MCTCVLLIDRSVCLPIRETDVNARCIILFDPGTVWECSCSATRPAAVSTGNS